MSMDVVTAGDARHVAGVVAGITGLHPGIFVLHISPPIPRSEACDSMYVQWGGTQWTHVGGTYVHGLNAIREGDWLACSSYCGYKMNERAQ